ncbi:AzlC family ABC transporter permease [Treponema sp.]|uniref:AzlC family ABC transporter permease n=1 Tax=Treponema sp. TaxID=166 RepID=UPI00388D2911
MNNKSAFLNGLAAGIPIGLGYFAVSFSLGIVARKAGLNPFQGFTASWFNLASAGEYALFTSIEQVVTYIEVAVITFVVNARYMLMSCALTQKFSSEIPFFHRFLVAFGITDEIFGVSISQKGVWSPFYNYGVMAVAVPLWSLGTSLGIIAGNILPSSVVCALSVALYGMFIAIIIPAAKKNMTIAAAVLISFALSWGFSVLPYIKNLSGGNRTIILTVVISAVLAYLKPVEETEN